MKNRQVSVIITLLIGVGCLLAQDPTVPTPYLVIDTRNGMAIPCVGCQIFTYQAGSSTPQATYTDSTLTVANTNPVITNSAGYAASSNGTITGIWVGNACYKFVLEDANSVTIWTQDYICDQARIQQPIIDQISSIGVFDISYVSLNSACAAATTKPLYITKDWVSISTQTLPCDVIFQGGIVQPSGGQTVTFAGSVTMPLGQQVFDISAGGAIHLASGSVTQITPQNFGAKEDGSTDDTAKVQAAMDSVCYSGNCIATVLWLPGTYATTAQLNGYASGISYSGLKLSCPTQGIRQYCQIAYNGSTSSSALRTIGYNTVLDGITITDAGSGWASGWSYDGQSGIGISTMGHDNNTTINCAGNPGDGLWGEQNNYQADQLLSDNLYVYNCPQGSGVKIWSANAVSYTFNKPEILYNQTGIWLKTSLNATINGGEFDENGVNFLQELGTVLSITGTRSEGSSRQYWGGGPSGAQQNLVYSGNLVSSFATTRASGITAAIASSSMNITFSASGFALGDKIVVAGAGSAGGSLTAQIKTLNGLAGTLDTAASTTVTTGAVTLNTGVASGAVTGTGSATLSGTSTQTCNIALGAGGGTATVALTGSNAIANGTAITVVAIGSYGTAPPTTGTLSSGTATCSGPIGLSTVLTQQDQFISFTNGSKAIIGNFFNDVGANSVPVTFAGEGAFAATGWNFFANSFGGNLTNPYGVNTTPPNTTIPPGSNIYDANAEFGGPYPMTYQPGQVQVTLTAGASTIAFAPNQFYVTANTIGFPGAIANVTGVCTLGQTFLLYISDSGGTAYTTIVASGNILPPGNTTYTPSADFLTVQFVCRAPNGWGLVLN